MLINGFKNLVAIAAETEIEFKEAATFKEYLKVHTIKSTPIVLSYKQLLNSIIILIFQDPSKFAVAVAAPVESAAPAQSAKKEEKVESEEEEDDDMGFGLFD